MMEQFEIAVNEEGDGHIKCVEQKRHLQDILNIVLCSERVNQMNKTYNDINAVTRLLEEKENDLELAARIGQGLLEKNKELSFRAETLEDALNESTDKISQLRHELSMKDALLHTFSEDYDTDCYTPVSKGYSAQTAYKATVENLQLKLKELEGDNSTLKTEVEQLLGENETWEYREQGLIEDCVRQLDDANKHVKLLEVDLTSKNDRLRNLEREIDDLSRLNLVYASKSDKLTEENAELQKSLEESHGLQVNLNHKLAELRDKFSECESLLFSAREEAKALRAQAQPSIVHQHYGPGSSALYPPTESLARELQRSWSAQEEGSLPVQGVPSGRNRKHLDRILDTARSVRRSSRQTTLDLSDSLTSADLDLPGDLDLKGGGEIENLSLSCPPHHIEPHLLMPSKSRPSFDTESLASETVSEPAAGLGDALDLFLLERRTLGRPGIPGSNDLETALRRLSLHQQGSKFTSESCLVQAVDKEKKSHQIRSHDQVPHPTPGSLSLASPVAPKASGFSSIGQAFVLPDKLQIVKPLEGSLTLHQWKRLAQPRIETLLEAHPGVRVQGQSSTAEESQTAEVFSLADVEEDDDTLYVRSLGTAAVDMFTGINWLSRPVEEKDRIVSETKSDDAESVHLEEYLNPNDCERFSNKSITSLVKEKGITGKMPVRARASKSSTHRVKQGLLRLVKSILPTSMLDRTNNFSQKNIEDEKASATPQKNKSNSQAFNSFDSELFSKGSSQPARMFCPDSPSIGLNSMMEMRRQDAESVGAVTRIALHRPSVLLHSTPHGHSRRQVKRLAAAPEKPSKSTFSAPKSTSGMQLDCGDYKTLSKLQFPCPGQICDARSLPNNAASENAEDSAKIASYQTSQAQHPVRRSSAGTQLARSASCGAHGDGLNTGPAPRNVGTGAAHNPVDARRRSKCSQTEK